MWLDSSKQSKDWALGIPEVRRIQETGKVLASEVGKGVRRVERELGPEEEGESISRREK